MLFSVIRRTSVRNVAYNLTCPVKQINQRKLGPICDLLALASRWTHTSDVADSAGTDADSPVASQQSAPSRLWPTVISLPKEAKDLKITFNTGGTFCLSPELLRVYTPSADRLKAGRQVVSGRRYVRILRGELVGNYGINLHFDDLHSSGIYTWDLLHDLGKHKFARCRSYLKALKALGLSRDPKQRVFNRLGLKAAGPSD